MVAGRGLAQADYLSGVVDGPCFAIGASEVAEIDD